MSDSEIRDGTSKSVKSSGSASSSRSGNSSSSESAAEGEEQEDSSSHLAQCQVKVHEAVEDELSNFRQLWKKDISNCQNKTQTSQCSPVVDEDNNEDEEIKRKAEKWFLEGVENERNGKLHEAIRFYKKAVQLVPDIEFKLCNKQRESSQNENIEENTDENSLDRTQIIDNDNESLNEEDEDDKETDLMLRLQHFISRSKSICTPVIEQKMTHISSLPMEIILYILRWVVSEDLDLRSLEMCSMVCRGFYVCSRDPEIWRLACLKVWGINCGCLQNYDSWRSMFLTRPRLNFNGCYISRTTYIRHGEDGFQDQFYRPWHLVEYYRYFRFFPEGTVFMLTTPDQPSRVTCILKERDNKHPSILSGHYRLQNDRVLIVLHRENFANNMFRKWKNNVPSDLIEQTYHIELQVTSRKQKINHCLLWKRYCVTSLRGNTETKTNFEVMSNKFPSFWFSRVKSYTLESEKPLA